MVNLSTPFHRVLLHAESVRRAMPFRSLRLPRSRITVPGYSMSGTTHDFSRSHDQGSIRRLDCAIRNPGRPAISLAGSTQARHTSAARNHRHKKDVEKRLKAKKT